MPGDENKLISALFTKNTTQFIQAISFFQPNELDFVINIDLILAHADSHITSFCRYFTPLNAALVWGTLEMVENLLSYGASQLSNDKRVMLPLQIACHWGSPEAVSLLLKYRGDYFIRLQSSQGYSVLDYANCRHDEHKEQIVLLLKQFAFSHRINLSFSHLINEKLLYGQQFCMDDFFYSIIHKNSSLKRKLFALLKVKLINFELLDLFFHQQDQKELWEAMFLPPEIGHTPFSYLCAQDNIEYAQFIIVFFKKSEFFSISNVLNYMLQPSYDYRAKKIFGYLLLEDYFNLVANHSDRFSFPLIRFYYPFSKTQLHPLQEVMDNASKSIQMKSLSHHNLNKDKKLIYMHLAILDKRYLEAFELIENLHHPLCFELAKRMLDNNHLAEQQFGKNKEKFLNVLMTLLSYAVNISSERIDQCIASIFIIYYPQLSPKKDVNFIGIDKLKHILSNLIEKYDNEPPKKSYLSKLFDSSPEFKHIAAEILRIDKIQQQFSCKSFVMINSIDFSLSKLDIIDFQDEDDCLILDSITEKDVESLSCSIELYKMLANRIKLGELITKFPYRCSGGDNISASSWAFKLFSLNYKPSVLFKHFYRLEQKNFNHFYRLQLPKFLLSANYYKQIIMQETAFILIYKTFVKKQDDPRRQYALLFFKLLMANLTLQTTTLTIRTVLDRIESDRIDKTKKHLLNSGPLPTQKEDNPFIQAINQLKDIREDNLSRIFNSFVRYLKKRNDNLNLPSNERVLIDLLIESLEKQDINTTNQLSI